MISRLLAALLLLAPGAGFAQTTPFIEKLVAGSPWEVTINPGRAGNPVTFRQDFRMSAEGRLEATIRANEWVAAERLDDRSVKWISRDGHTIVVKDAGGGNVTITHSNSRASSIKSTK
jgi:hypothetical protein